MRKKLLVLALLAGTLSAQADEYPYLIFETTDGGRTPVEVESLTIQIVDGNLVAGGKTFSLASLSRMFFSAAKQSLQRGIYVMKGGSGTFKVAVK